MAWPAIDARDDAKLSFRHRRWRQPMARTTISKRGNYVYQHRSDGEIGQQCRRDECDDAGVNTK